MLASFYPDKVRLGTIYFEVRKYRKLSDWDNEATKYGEQRHHHIVRATLSQLVKRAWQKGFEEFNRQNPRTSNTCPIILFWDMCIHVR